MRPHSKVEYFSLGGLLSLWWQPRAVLLPWLVVAVTLAGLGCWDLLARGGSIDFILVGLAGYELVMGLTDDPGSATTSRRSPPPQLPATARGAVRSV